MRGQESGSEHEREADGSAAPATPPPSFGQPSPHVPRTDRTGDDQPYDPPAWPEPMPGAAQPWTVPGDDGAPYDWFADPEDDLPTPWPGSPRPGHPVSAEPRGQAWADLPRPEPHLPPWAGSSTPQGPSGPPPGAPGPAWTAPAPAEPPNAQWAAPAPTEPPNPQWATPAPAEPANPQWTAPAPTEPAGQPWTGSPAVSDPSGPQAWSGPASAGDPTSPPGPVPLTNPPLSTAPIVPGAPPWQPPPAFTAAAAGMQVWPSSGPDAHGVQQWPAATGEPVWSDHEETAARPGEAGDAPIWPAHMVPHDGLDDDTARIRPSDPAALARQEPVGLAPTFEPGGYTPDPTPPPGPERTPAPGSPSEAGLIPGLAPEPSPASGLASEPGQIPNPTSGPNPIPGPVPGLGAHGPAAPESDRISGPVSGPSPIPGPVSGPGAHGPNPAPSPGPDAQALGPLPSPEPGAQSSGPAFAAQSPVSQAEPVPPVPPSSSEPAAQGVAPSPVPSQLPEPATAGAFPSEQPPPGDQATPPGGIAVISQPSFSPVPAASPAQQPASTAEAARMRGPFTPPSGVAIPAAVPPPAQPVRSRSKTLVIAAVAAVVVGGIGAGAFYAYQSFIAKKPASVAGPVPSSEPVEPTEDPETPIGPDPVNADMLNSEQTDPGKMTVADAFTKKVTLAGVTFVRVKTDVTQQCQEAAAGKFASMLKSKDCRQVLRATYVDSKRKYAVTTGIAVLPTRESAVEADRAKNLNSNLWFRGLPGTPGTGAERVHIAGGYAAGLVWGRYIVFSYATYSDGHTPTAKEKGLGKVSGAFRDQTAKVVERRVTS
ncbi:hypothetical protein [Streptosporangium sp. NPDC000396]|uniref:hypothetical protein n=1 Tax=Streptosporangium sp. NPDC000396 TaxID=3366185 RepID=UPI0036826615